jgi:hypothetical protein
MIYKENDQQHLEEIKNGTSKLFPVVPDEIGDVVYCTTDNLELSKTEKEVKKSKTKKLIITILIVAAIVGFVSLSGVLILPIVAGVIGLAIIVYMALKKPKFEGRNEILGTDGFVMQWFENSRDNIRTSKIYKFSEMYDIIVSSTYKLMNGFYYTGSERHYRYWKLADRKSKWPTFDRKIYYNENSNNNDIDASAINIEELWTNYRLNIAMPAFENNEVVYFNYFKGYVTYEVCDKYIGISKDYIIIDGKEYNKGNIKDVRINNGKITIKTDQDFITLEVANIGSFRVFYTLLLEFAKNNLPMKLYASLGGDAAKAMKDALREQGINV